VNKKVRLSLKHVAPGTDESDIIRIERRDAGALAVGVKRLGAAVNEPFLQCNLPVDRIEQHLLVITLNVRHATSPSKFAQLPNDVATVGPAIDGVAEYHYHVIGPQLQPVDEGRQSRIAAVNITDCNRARSRRRYGT
jgi:hypothetical protein